MKNNEQIGIFICSCHKTKASAKHFEFSYIKYSNYSKFPIFWGTTNNEHPINSILNLNVLNAPVSNWRDEVIYQLKILKNKYDNINRIIFFLDDFILYKKPNYSLLDMYIKLISENNIKYLKLTPPEGSIFFNFFLYIKKLLKKNWFLYKISLKHPYYTSFHVAIWDIDYLINTIERCHNQWHLELLKSDTEHYSVLNNIFFYKHIMEKGKWDFGSKAFCIKSLGFFEKGDINHRKGLISFIISRLRIALFIFFGFLPMKFKRTILSKFFPNILSLETEYKNIKK